MSPAKGIVRDLSKVPDEAFSAKYLGDGFIVEPSNGEVYSPVEGEVAMIFPTLHAVGLKCSDGIEVLVHIGVDTVKLRGRGFSRLSYQRARK